MSKLSALGTQISSEIVATEKAPYILAEMYLDNLTLRWVLSSENITFPSGGSSLYIARAFDLDRINQSVEGIIQTVSISLDDVDGTFKVYENLYEFENRMLVLKRFYLSGESDAVPADGEMFDELFAGPMNLPDGGPAQKFKVSATLGDSLDKRMLTDYYNSNCNRIFGDKLCAQNLYDDTYYTKTGTADSGSTAGFIDDALDQVDNFFDYGRVEVTHDGIKYGRKIKRFVGNDSGEVQFDIGTPVAIENGDAYQVWVGCDNLWDTCAGNKAWGPSGENTLNFFGFPHIGSKRET